MSGEFDPNKRSREPLSPEMLELQRARKAARDLAGAPKPAMSENKMAEAPKSVTAMEYDSGSEDPEEGKRVRVKISAADREAHRRLIEEGKQKELAQKTSTVQTMMEAQSNPKTPEQAPVVPAKKSWLRRLFG